MKLIVGIDPGTTVGWALLDLDGSLVECRSKRNFSLDSLVKHVSARGSVLMVGCDKAKIPAFVQDFATKFHARVLFPKKDLSVAEKRELTRGCSFANAHERDALASALLAHRRSASLLRKVRANLERGGKESLFDEVCDLVIREGVSIHAAVSILTPPVVREEVPEEEEAQDHDLRSLYAQVRGARRDIAVLRERLEEVRKQRDQARKSLEELRKASAALVRPKSARVLGREKEERIHILSGKVEKEKRRVQALQKHVHALESLVLRDDVLAIPRMPRLSGEIPDKVGTAVFVDNPNEFSERVIHDLVDRGVLIVVCGKAPSGRVREQVPFAFVDKSVVVRMLNEVVFLDKRKFEENRSSKKVLRDVVKEYQRSRGGLS